MLGPLPVLHRWIVGVLAVLTCVGTGAWLAFALPIPLVAPTGAIIGAALGLVVLLGLLHGSEPHEPVRARRPR